jgi:hypothetical protein
MRVSGWWTEHAEVIKEALLRVGKYIDYQDMFNNSRISKIPSYSYKTAAFESMYTFNRSATTSAALCIE